MRNFLKSGEFELVCVYIPLVLETNVNYNVNLPTLKAKVKMNAIKFQFQRAM